MRVDASMNNLLLLHLYDKNLLHLFCSIDNIKILIRFI